MAIRPIEDAAPMTPTERVRSVLAIDPGTTHSAWCLLDSGAPVKFGTWENETILYLLNRRNGERLVVEMIASYGMPVGREVFETCVWIGRFLQQWKNQAGLPFELIYRRDIKLHLCNSVRAKDANIAQALRDRFGGKGTKAKPGALYGIKGDEWAALAVAVTYWDLSLRGACTDAEVRTAVLDRGTEVR